MALSVSQGFDVFLERLTPLQSERDAKVRHRRSVETSLRASTRFSVQLFRETGSFGHVALSSSRDGTCRWVWEAPRSTVG